jgi:hypothetical protein
MVGLLSTERRKSQEGVGKIQCRKEMVGLLTTGKKKGRGMELENWKGNGRTVNHWEEEKSWKGVGKSRKEMVELLKHWTEERSRKDAGKVDRK